MRTRSDIKRFFIITVMGNGGSIEKDTLYEKARSLGYDTYSSRFRSILLTLHEDGILNVKPSRVTMVGLNQ